jgi:hypothetical protein
MGYGLTRPVCATLINWRTQTGATGAVSIHFAPVRHLRQFLIGRGEGGALAHHHRSRARSTALRRHHVRLAPTAGRTWRSPEYLLDERGNEARCTLSVREGIELFIGMSVFRTAIGRLSTRQERRGSHAGANIQCQRPDWCQDPRQIISASQPTRCRARPLSKATAQQNESTAFLRALPHVALPMCFPAANRTGSHVA